MKKPEAGKTSWQILLESLPRYPSDPPGWLRIAEFAGRCGCAHSVVNHDLIMGKIPKRYLAAVPAETSGKLRVSIDWNNAGYDYVLQKRDSARPIDFFPNPERVYKPVPVAGVPTPVPTLHGGVGEPPVDVGILDRNLPTDIAEAKLRNEQLKIFQKQQELKIAANELISVEDAQSQAAEHAAELRGKLLWFINDVAARVVGREILEVQAILRDGLAHALEGLGREGGE